MAKNITFRDVDSLTLPVPSGTLSGAPVAVGGIAGVALTSRDTAGNATVLISPSHVAEVTTADAVASVGLAIYVTSAGVVTTTATSNTLLGYALATKGGTSGIVPVLFA
ncbi:DUF2190 family protein [Xylanimonas protaetiae]|uniref:DUF2190 family protein n=1 Tax=Xylanimonas protaetiae TaxID=2509457 RepID=A0A4P6F394_9MICO|nr:DUF2190 family protein [Xylanimonas protaetiae]QAY69994.1 DUF2190 family protein [Xylanimonas protaetiae]